MMMQTIQRITRADVCCISHVKTDLRKSCRTCKCTRWQARRSSHLVAVYQPAFMRFELQLQHTERLHTLSDVQLRSSSFALRVPMVSSPSSRLSRWYLQACLKICCTQRAHISPASALILRGFYCTRKPAHLFHRRAEVALHGPFLAPLDRSLCVARAFDIHACSLRRHNHPKPLSRSCCSRVYKKRRAYLSQRRGQAHFFETIIAPHIVMLQIGTSTASRWAGTSCHCIPHCNKGSAQ